jgi:hypothetical protein
MKKDKEKKVDYDLLLKKQAEKIKSLDNKEIVIKKK